MNTTIHKPHQRLLAIALSFVMLLGFLPMTAFAESDVPDMGVSGEIIAFELLTEEAANQTVPLGTSLDKLNLPETLTAALRVAMPTDATISSGKISETTESTIPVSVTWVSEPEYDGDTEGTCIFTAQMSGYTLSAEPPLITVTVGKAAQKITLLVDAPLAAGDVNRTHYAYDATAKKLTIKTNEGPASYKYYKDIPIADVTTVEILDGVTYIDTSAFGNFSALTSVQIAESVTKIHSGAFANCSALPTILLPLKLTSIGDSAFAGCTSLAGITIPGSVTSIGDTAFFECSSLSSILISPSVTSIGERAFDNCTSLKAVGIPNSVSRIEALTFVNCTSLASVTLPDSVTFVGHQAFWKCKSLTSVTLPKTVTSISEEAFKGCSSLTIRLTSDTAPSFGIEWANSVPAVYYPGKWGAPNTITNLNYSNNAKGIIDHAKIQGIYQPFGNIAPNSTVAETAQYTGTVTWSPNDNLFKGKTVYTATITLTPKDGFTLLYVPADFFTLPFGPPNVSSVSNAANSGVITAVFPETSEFLAITIKDIPGVAVPVAGAIPADIITETEQYTGTVTWFPADSTFKPNTAYTATIILTPKDNFVFLSVGENFFTVAGAKTSNAVMSSKVTAEFPAAPTYTATINPTSKTFPVATAGYGAQTTQEFTITNTGTGQITGLSAILGGSSFEISTVLSETSINTGETAVISVRPKTGLAAGTHTDTLTITDNNGVSLTANLSFEVTAAPTYTATVNPTSKTFPAATAGYSAQTAQQFTITNTGTGQITGLSAILGGSSFEISTVLSETSINAGETAAISVRPKTGLAAGTHTDTLTITGSNGVSLSVNLSFTVNRIINEGGSSDWWYTPEPIIPTDKQPNMPTVAKMGISGTVKDSILSATITEKMAKDAIKAAQDASKKSGKEADGIAVEFNITGNGSYDNLSIVIKSGAIDHLKEAGVKFVKIGSPVLDVTLDTVAIAELDKQSTGTVTVSAKKLTKLSDSATKLIGNRPVYDITISYQKNGKTKYVGNFGKGAVTLGLAYKATANEKSDNLFGVYVDKNGKPQLLTNSSYDNGRLIFSRNSLSTYGVGYKTPAPSFTDTAKHWAKDNIDFVASRDLISGTSATTFAPNTDITRADFLMALGRLSGADVSSYKTSSFTDVESIDNAMPYIEWAVKNKIVSGYGNGKFGPIDSITREQMAVMMVNYAKATGYKLPVSKQANTFADDAKISAYAKDAVKAIQQTGIINGKDNNRLDPQGNATRAEASTILRRFVELVIDEGTARLGAERCRTVAVYQRKR